MIKIVFQLSVPNIAPQTLTYDFPQGFAGGLDISKPADLIAPNCSPDMLNMCFNIGSKPTKRFGFTRVNAVSWGNGGIKGMAEYTPPGGTLKRIVAWNGKLWELASDGTKTDLMTGSKTSIADSQCWFFIMNDKLYCLTGTDYVYYDGNNPVADVTGHIPLVVIGKAPDGTGGASNEELNQLTDSWTEGFTADGSSTEYVLTVAPDSIDKVTINGSTADPSTYSLATNKVTFGTAPATDAVVEITATKDGMNDATLITKCTTGIIYGGRNDTRIILTGNPDYTNWRFESYLTDPTYFPATSGYTLVGSDAEKLTCFGRMIDYLINFKYDKIFYSSIEFDANGVSFPTYPMNDEYGCIAPRTVKPAQGGLLALSRDGVIWVKPSLVRGQLNVDMISEKINGYTRNGVAAGILDDSISNLENAHAIIDHGKYRLSINNKTWVLDLNYSDLANKIYCWYPYDGVYANAGQFLLSGESLYLGHSTLGVVYKQNRSNYNDDGAAVDGWWTSPLIFGGSRDWIKKFLRLNITFKGQPEGNHIFTIITDQGKEEIAVLVETQGTFDYGSINYGVFSYGVPIYPSSQSEKVGYKGEYIQWQIRNKNEDEGLCILSQSLQYSLLKMVK